MSLIQKNSLRNNHTIVLQSRSVGTSQSLVIGSKQEHLSRARGSPPGQPPDFLHKHVHPPPRKWVAQCSQHQDDFINRTNLLVRFGIDSYFGRVVARVLVWLMLFQPVYVAMGMELEDGAMETVTPTQNEIVEEVPEETGAEEVSEEVSEEGSQEEEKE